MGSAVKTSSPAPADRSHADNAEELIFQFPKFPAQVRIDRAGGVLSGTDVVVIVTAGMEQVKKHGRA